MTDLPHITIRSATENDAPALLGIYTHYVANTAISFETDVPSLEEFRKRIVNTMIMYPYLVAEYNGNIAGYAYASRFSERAAYDWTAAASIYVDRNHNKKGIGRALYAALEDILTRMNVLSINAGIAVPETEDEYLTMNSVQFHEHMGYKKAAEFHKCGYKFGKWYNVVWMEKMLAPHSESPAVPQAVINVNDLNSTGKNRPIIGIPMGDPAGIGPEIVVKALSHAEIHKAAKCVVIGDSRILKKAISITDVPISIHMIDLPAQGIFNEGVLNLIPVDTLPLEEFSFGTISAECGKAAYTYIEKSILLTMNGEFDSIATTPINKEALKAGGVPYIGHTEIFESLTGTKDPLTMFEVRGLRIFFLTRHVSLKKACGLVTKDKIIEYVKRCTDMLRTLGVENGTMAIAGLNPHSGEHGLFGSEEMEEVIPAIEQLQKEGYAVTGPVGADSVFHLALQGRFNSVLSLYHDQGHIASKTLDFEKTISVTGGMPILRTSVDHGTAMDIAGTGVASEISMMEAILLGAKYAENFKKR